MLEDNLEDVVGILKNLEESLMILRGRSTREVRTLTVLFVREVVAVVHPVTCFRCPVYTNGCVGFASELSFHTGAA